MTSITELFISNAYAEGAPQPRTEASWGSCH